MTVTIWNKLRAEHYYRCTRKAAIKKNTDLARNYMDRALELDPENSVYILGNAIIAGLEGKYNVAIDLFLEALQLIENSNLREADRDYLMAFAAHSMNYYAKKDSGDVRYEIVYETLAARVKLSRVSRRWLNTCPARFMEDWEGPYLFVPEAGLLNPVNRSSLYELLMVPFLSAAFSFWLFGKLHIAVSGLLLGWVLYCVYLQDQRVAKTPNFILFPIIPSGLFVTFLFSPEYLIDNVVASISVLFLVSFALRVWVHVTKREIIPSDFAIVLSAAGAWMGFPGLAAVLSGGAVIGLIFLLLGDFSMKFVSGRHWPVTGFLAISFMLVWFYGPAIPALQS